MDFPIRIDTTSMGLPIVHFKVSRVEFSKWRCISVLEGCFNLSKQCRPRCNAALYCISSGSSLYAKVPAMGFPVNKRLNSFLLSSVSHFVQLSESHFCRNYGRQFSFNSYDFRAVVQ